MSMTSQGPGWWQATDALWYPPDQRPNVPQQVVPDAASPPVAPLGPMGPIGKDRSPASVLGLSIITFGVYYLVWYYKINDEIRRHDPDIQVNPLVSVLAISVGAILLFIPPLVSSYATAARIRQMQLDEQATDTISPIVALLLHIFLGIGYPLYIASQLREHWHGHQRADRMSVTSEQPAPPVLPS